ncbi:hypothetical protein V3C99_017912 [Haemonchus contortus]
MEFILLALISNKLLYWLVSLPLIGGGAKNQTGSSEPSTRRQTEGRLAPSRAPYKTRGQAPTWTRRRSRRCSTYP